MIKAPILLLLFAVLLASCNTRKDQYEVGRTDLIISVYGAASIKASHQYQVYSTVTGLISEILIQEGDTVEAGEIILTVENTNPELNTQNASLALQLAKENYTGAASALNNLELQLELAKEKVQEDSVNYFRQKRLWDQNIGSEIELENRSFAYQASQNNLNLLKVQKQQLENELETALKQAENNYDISLNQASDFEIRSQIAGRVYGLYKEAGELVNPQQPLALIGEKGSFYLELEVDQMDIADIELGQEVVVRLDAYKDRLFSALVSKIYPLMDTKSQTFKVDASFNEPMPKLYPGLSGEANIIVSKKSDVLAIPLGYLAGENRVLDEKGDPVEIVIGDRNMELVEVLEGLEEGQVIQKPEE